MLSDDRCTDGLNSPSWVPGWEIPLHKAFMRAITPVSYTHLTLPTNREV